MLTTLEKLYWVQNGYKKFIAPFYKLTHTSVIKHFFMYAGGALFLRSITILMAPINMRMLTPHDYGSLALVNSFISISTAITGLGLRQVLSIEFFHGNNAQRLKLINDIIIMYVSIMGPLLLLSIYFHTVFYSGFFANCVPASVIIASLVIVFVYFFVELLYQVLQYKQKARTLTLLQTSAALLTAFITITFLYYLQLGFASIIWAQLVSMILTCSIGFYLYYKKNYWLYLQITSSLKHTIRYLKLGLPFIPTMLFGWILASGDRWLLARYCSLHDVGIYSIADTFGQLFQFLILNPWSGSYLPYILNKFCTSKGNLLDIEQHNQRIMTASMIAIAILITSGYVLSRPILHSILPEAYHEAISYIWIILMGYVFLLGSYFASSFIQFHKKTYFLALALCIPALLNIIFNMILIPHYAVYGCAMATLASYILYFIITLGYNWRLQKLYV